MLISLNSVLSTVQHWGWVSKCRFMALVYGWHHSQLACYCRLATLQKDFQCGVSKARHSSQPRLPFPMTLLIGIPCATIKVNYCTLLYKAVSLKSLRPIRLVLRPLNLQLGHFMTNSDCHQSPSNLLWWSANLVSATQREFIHGLFRTSKERQS